MQFEYVLNSIKFRCAICNEINIINDNLSEVMNKRIVQCKCGLYYRVPFDYRTTYHNKNLILIGKEVK